MKPPRRRRRPSKAPVRDGSFWLRSRRVGDICSLALFGDLDEVTIEALCDELERLQTEPPRWILLDLGELCFVDAAAAAHLTRLGADLERRGTRVTVLDAPAVVRRRLTRACAADTFSFPSRQDGAGFRS